jgi:preprotein translocase subunit SecY
MHCYPVQYWPRLKDRCLLQGMMQALPEMQPEVVHAGATQPPRGTVLLVRRVALIIAILLIYRIGTFIPAPGVDWDVIYRVFTGTSHFSSAIARVSVLALGLWPYITASIFIQLLIWLAPGLERKTATNTGRKQIGLYMRLLTVPVAALQADAIAIALRPYMLDAAAADRVAIVTTMTAGTMFLVWLSDQITKLEIGDGVLLILSADIVANLPHSALIFVQYVQLHNIPPGIVASLAVLMFAILAGLVFVELGQRRIPVVYQQLSEGNRSFLLLKINSAGVLPLLFPPLLFAPLAFLQLRHEQGPEWLHALAGLLWPGQPFHLAVATAVVVFFTFCFATDPRAAADNLRRSGGNIPGIQPGPRTMQYIAYVLKRLTVLAAAYLAAVYAVPGILHLLVRDPPFNFGGFSLLAVVIAAVDILRRLRSAGLGVLR